MEAKDPRRSHQRQGADVLHVCLIATFRWRNVGFSTLLLVQNEVVLQCLLAVVALQQRGQEPPVHRLRDAAPVVALPRQVVQRLDWGLIRVLVQEHLQLSHGDPQVVLRELVGDVPAQRPEESALLDHGVEEAKVEGQALELPATGAGFEKLLIADGVHVVGARHVSPQAFGSFIRHLHAILQNCDGELVGRIRSEPKAEILVNLFRVLLIQQPLQSGHPGRCQVTILEENPSTVLRSDVHESFRLRSLSLPQRDGSNLAAFLAGETIQVASWICAW
mmetsp:Transcript_14245/g.33969  ORF Transcript_14245/g.33969 Transcript_14245/m.33969 type:complete len:277 (-) Transcript_14245:1322-2152(-)